ncbi:SnoaL-like domain-containing protein [Pseudarcicella hirudinis]|uniref:SnoaL-like domain-containing protein n=1 Tax=Pseudarcicella hirudinis TaxID=1079859 RepID=A0A1I5MJX5_9BACT|nr:nuclear transport factor 2 family protein [Pseudarcicella hirudinis]SFP09231.1 SnoaL-like domain-containing protein [Pseudarcicella hirudinis]
MITNPNQDIIDRFFALYAERDFQGISEVMTEDVKWFFIGDHPLSGISTGIREVVGFFDKMGKIMSNSDIRSEKLVTGTNENYLVECQHIVTNRSDGNNLDYQVCVLWTFRNRKIAEGKHFFADSQAANSFFSAVANL